MSISGKCVCGAVSYSISKDKSEFGACHCSTCRRWSGGVFLGLEVKPDEISFEGEEHLTRYSSSQWAERAFCSKCGASMYYRITAPGPYEGVYHLGVGTLDSCDDMRLSEQLFIDQKPNGYSFAEKTHNLTQAQFEAMFGVG